MKACEMPTLPQTDTEQGTYVVYISPARGRLLTRPKWSTSPMAYPGVMGVSVCRVLVKQPLEK